MSKSVLWLPEGNKLTGKSYPQDHSQALLFPIIYTLKPKFHIFTRRQGKEILITVNTFEEDVEDTSLPVR